MVENKISSWRIYIDKLQNKINYKIEWQPGCQISKYYLSKIINDLGSINAGKVIKIAKEIVEDNVIPTNQVNLSHGGSFDW